MYAVETTFDRDLYGKRNRYERFEDPDLAVQRFESEAGTPRRELDALLEELTKGEKLESFDDETGKRVIAFELVEAVV